MFYKETDAPADTLENTRAILRFVQSWVEADIHDIPTQEEISGLSMTLEAARFLVFQAEETVRKAKAQVIA